MARRFSTTHPSRPRLSHALQRHLLDAISRTGARRPAEASQPSENHGGGRDVDKRGSKRRPTDTDGVEQIPAKKSRLTPGDAGYLDHGNVEKQADEAALQQPRPRRPQKAYAAFLRDFVDPNPPVPSGPVYSFVSGWLATVGRDQEPYCRSDSCLDLSDAESSSRESTKSAPAVAFAQDQDRFAMPPTPMSGAWPSSRATSLTQSNPTENSTGSGRRRALIEAPCYRDVNLAAHNICFRDSFRSCHELFPDRVASLIAHVSRDRGSPGPSTEAIRRDTRLERLVLGASKFEVEDYFRAQVFPPPGTVLERCVRQPMARHAVPNTGSRRKISTPVPDIMYGYRRPNIFRFGQEWAQLESMGEELNATNGYQGTILPFFIVEFKGEGESLYVATNQCLGGSAACVNLAERLNEHSKRYSNNVGRGLNSAAFSIAMNGSEARLYVSWRTDSQEYHMANVESFLLQRPDDYREFRKYVRNIIDWGEKWRYDEIREALDALGGEKPEASGTAEDGGPHGDEINPGHLAWV
ncbi:hypothetical protein F4780DRAFT_621834 [Xylariomycetidae sp. FL0641]|nr:hypothetical protein F4780DRAFT_621834 [Xylariomycetidae sp. FL0641]